MPILDASIFKEPILATLVYLILYYCFLYLQSGVAFYLFAKAKNNANQEAKARGEKPEKVSLNKIKYGSKDRLSLMAARTVGNMMEQAIPFLTSLWLHAIFVSPEDAAKIAWIYIACRSIYPLTFYVGFPYILLSTVPDYICIVMLLKPLVLSLLK